MPQSCENISENNFNFPTYAAIFSQVKCFPPPPASHCCYLKVSFLIAAVKSKQPHFLFFCRAASASCWKQILVQSLSLHGPLAR